jgi:hypothetical protein
MWSEQGRVYQGLRTDWEADSHHRVAAEFKLVPEGAKQSRIVVELHMFWIGDFYSNENITSV